MGPYYDYITMLALGFTPPPGSTQPPGARPGLAAGVRSIWNWIKPRRPGMTSVQAQLEAGGYQELLRRDRPDRLNPLIR